MEPQQFAVVVTATNKAQSKGTITRIEIPGDVRRKKALKSLSLCWLAALLSVPIPGLHFILVPTFLLTGIGAGVYQLFQKIRLTSSGIECPECHKSSPVPEMKEQWPLDFQCPKCGRRMWMEQVS